jgi:DNA-binding LacI/PurR family transcriptional regulator
MRARGLTAPTDIAVIGVDDIPTARLAVPPLSTVAFDLHEAGRRRAEAVVAALAGRDRQVSSDPAPRRSAGRAR